MKLLIFIFKGLQVLNWARLARSEGASLSVPLQRGSINCPGPRPDFYIYQHPEWNDQEITAQQICAKEFYGGLPTGMYGYCLQADEFDPRWPVPAIAFEESPPNVALSRQIELSAHIALFCQQNCYCDKWRPVNPSSITEVSFKPRGYAKRLGAYEQTSSSDNGMQLRISLAPPSSQHQHIRWVWDLQPFTPGPSIHTRMTDILLGDQLREINTLYQGRKVSISLEPNNQIMCMATPLPSNLILPYPYRMRDFRRNANPTHHICAAALNGGNPGANAGAICYQSSEGSHIGFAESLMPRAEWKASPFKSVLQAYCRSACQCTYSETTSGSDYGSETEMDIENPRRFRNVVVLNPAGLIGLGTTYAESDSGDSSSCPMDSTNCPIRDLAAPSVPTTSSGPTCGATCDGPSRMSCPGAPSGERCNCVYLSDTVTRLVGMDPVSMSGTAMCLVTSYLRQKMSDAKQRGVFASSNRLNGRSLAEMDLEWNCMCNSTYASSGCCGSETGIVWEGRGLRLDL
ncbi:MAG: hypothetical protein M1814_001389 [Vezdaea aestivalis]|nr:MAG: hypothetical protein M1814_001389 [Vezdaea aestivalis]